MKDLIEGLHYYINDDGYIVLTEQYHYEKGYCCGNGCQHCPFEYENMPEPRKALLLKDKNPSTNSGAL